MKEGRKEQMMVRRKEGRKKEGNTKNERKEKERKKVRKEDICVDMHID